MISVTWEEVSCSFRDHLQANQTIIAAGSFGSVARGQVWPHSDLDVIIILESVENHAEAVYSRWHGRIVHSQLLSAKSLQAALARNNYAFLSVVAGLDIWFDSQGVLSTAVGAAKQALQTVAASLLPDKLTAGLAALHTAEKCLALKEQTAAQSALISALNSLAAAKLVSSGCLPSKDVWLTPEASALFEHQLHSQGAQGANLEQVVQQAWHEVHALLAAGSAPLIELVKERGPLSYMQLERAPELSKLTLTERLMHELVGQGLLMERTKVNPLLKVDEVVYAVR